MKTRSQLKEEAKDMLRGRWSQSALMCLVPVLLMIAFALIMFFFVALPMYALFQNGIDFTSASANGSTNGNSGSSFVSGLFSTLFGAGISWTFLDIFRGKKETIEPFRDAFRGFNGRYFIAILCIYVLSSIFLTLWLFVFLIPAFIKYYSYSQAYFILYDTYEETGIRPGFLDCITASRRLMDGYKGQLFLLDLSFIGWHLLALLTFGIGYLWLTPYISATKAAFYDNLPKTVSVN